MLKWTRKEDELAEALRLSIGPLCLEDLDLPLETLEQAGDYFRELAASVHNETLPFPPPALAKFFTYPYPDSDEDEDDDDV